MSELFGNHLKMEIRTGLFVNTYSVNCFAIKTSAYYICCTLQNALQKVFKLFTMEASTVNPIQTAPCLVWGHIVRNIAGFAQARKVLEFKGLFC